MRKVKKMVHALQGWTLTGIVSLCLFLSACGISENIDSTEQEGYLLNQEQIPFLMDLLNYIHSVYCVEYTENTGVLDL